MGSAATALPSRTQNQPGGLPKNYGAKTLSTTPAPKVSPADDRVAAGVGAPGVGRPDGNVGKGLNGNVGKGPNALSEAVLRAGFLRKVYGLLTAQLAFTVVVTTLCMVTPVVRNMFLKLALYHSWGLQLAITSPWMVSLLVLKRGMKNKYPVNYVLLLVFTMGISFQVCYVCSVYHALGYTHLILQACGATTAIFFGLTAYVLYSGKDFSYLGGFLYMALWGLVLVGIGRMFFPWLEHGLFLGFAGAMVFSGYILYDTWRIRNKFGYDDYIGATIRIYMDVVSLFLRILQILVKLQRDGKKKKNQKR